MREASLQERASAVMPGGVGAGWNALPDTGAIHMVSGSGAYVTDVYGNRRCDFVCGWGSLILGHDPAPIRSALKAALEDGCLLFQYETEYTVQLAELICRLVPCAEKVRFANSGLEAVQYAIRIARAATGRRTIVKFEGHFHGLHDYVTYNIDTCPRLGASRENGLELIQGTTGAPADLDALTIVLAWNDAASLERVLLRHGRDIAAVLLEPVALNVGCIPPAPGFLELLRELTAKLGIVLVFDEVLTGFRLAAGGAQELFGVTPDIACFGKALGGGMPIAAVAGRADLLDTCAPVGGVQMSGTNTGRAFAVRGALANLRHAVENDVFSHLRALNDRVETEVRLLAEAHGVPCAVRGFGARVGIYPGMETLPRDLRDISEQWNSSYHRACYQHIAATGAAYGALLPLKLCPEPLTLSAAHGDREIDLLVSLLDDAWSALPYRSAVHGALRV